MLRFPSRQPLFLVAIFVGGAVVLAAPAADRPASIPFPDGIAASDGKTAFVINADGGIDALDLAKGELLWDTKEAVKPLALKGKLLMAQTFVKDKGNQLRLVVLDVDKKGKKQSESDLVIFPDWAVVAATGQGSSFFTRARIDKDDLYLFWDAHRWYYGGAAPTPDILKAAKKDEAGVARINLGAGKVEMLAKDKVPDLDPKLPKELEKIESQQYWSGSDWLKKPLIAGDKAVALAVKQDGDKQTLTLKRWDLSSGKELEAKELVKGKSLWPQIGLDGKHVFVHQALVKEHLPDGDYVFWVFDLESGEQVAELPYETMESPTVLGRRLYYAVVKPAKGGGPGFGVMEQPRALKAVDLKTGKVDWERPLAPRKFYPPPP
jgi:hypothetical protein